MKKEFKFLSLAAATLLVGALASCSDEKIGGNEEPFDGPNDEMSVASYTVGGGDQSRAANTGYWHSSSRSASAYAYNFPAEMAALDTPFEVPAGAEELKDDWSHNQNASVYVIPAGKTVTVQVPNNFGGKLYVAGTYKPQYFGNNSNGLTLYVLPGGEFEYTDGININGGNIYNQGTVTLPGFDGVKIQNIYNAGLLKIGSEKADLDFQAGVSIYSKGDVVMTGGWNPYWHDANSYQIDFKGTFICDGTLTLNGRTHVQNIENEKDICNVVADDLVIDATVCVGSLNATTIKFDGDIIKLHPEGYVYASDEINMPNSGCQVLAYEEGCKGLVETPKFSIHLINDPLAVAIGQGVYLQTENLYDQASNVNYTDLSGFEVASQNHINQGVKVNPAACGAAADPEPTPEPEDPSLDQVVDIESPTHDHDADKTDDHRRHLSATSLAFDGNGNIYASYHMRGGNWGGDTYDKDDIEGCIERWSFDGNEIEIGNWMWTNEFDFNHIILDGSDIITVGHKGGEGHNGVMTDFGGIIGRLPVSFYNRTWDADETLTREDFNYKYLTTEKPLLNENGKIEDYQNAGDGNCVIKVGDKYYVATSAGYGVIDSNFKRVKDEAGNVLFTSTPGSAKYLVENNGEVNVLYLNDRIATSTATTSFAATLATMTSSNFPFAANTQTMQANVTPVDGKNVIAVSDGVVYACLSKGGLQIGNEIVTFGDGRSVNGVAVDDKYVYVANGNYISVLDKASKGVVVERKGDTENVSANFVEVKEFNGKKYVFVAFGQEGVKVYHFKNC